MRVALVTFGGAVLMIGPLGLYVGVPDLDSFFDLSSAHVSENTPSRLGLWTHVDRDSDNGAFRNSR